MDNLENVFPNVAKQSEGLRIYYANSSGEKTSTKRAMRKILTEVVGFVKTLKATRVITALRLSLALPPSYVPAVTYFQCGGCNIRPPPLLFLGKVTRVLSTPLDIKYSDKCTLDLLPRTFQGKSLGLCREGLPIS